MQVILLSYAQNGHHTHTHKIVTSQLVVHCCDILQFFSTLLFSSTFDWKL